MTDLLQALNNGDYAMFNSILDTNKTYYSSNYLGHILAYILPKTALKDELKKKFKTRLINTGADLLLFAHACGCQLCVEFCA
jgi:hypothetical protein